MWPVSSINLDHVITLLKNFSCFPLTSEQNSTNFIMAFKILNSISYNMTLHVSFCLPLPCMIWQMSAFVSPYHVWYDKARELFISLHIHLLPPLRTFADEQSLPGTSQLFLPSETSYQHKYHLLLKLSLAARARTKFLSCWDAHGTLLTLFTTFNRCRHRAAQLPQC